MADIETGRIEDCQSACARDEESGQDGGGLFGDVTGNASTSSAREPVGCKTPRKAFHRDDNGGSGSGAGRSKGTSPGEKSIGERDALSLSANGLTVLKRRYLRKGSDGTPVETPEELFRRVARNVASAEELVPQGEDPREVEERFYRLMTSLRFMPNSPTLMNAGRELQQLSACFVLPIEDSIDSIFETVKNTALIHKSGGGTGFSFSRIRPKNDIVATSHGYASGPISFLRVFNEATEAINQGGFRRGANMGILQVDHPDILDFIGLKAEDKRISNFNISVGFTAPFMRALARDEEYELFNPHLGEPCGRLEARRVFDAVVSMAWKNGEPGIVFLDTINAVNPTPELGEIESTNPCGEQPLLPYEACNLGSINLGKMVSDGRVDYDLLRRVVYASVHFLDNVIEVNRYPLPEIEALCKGNRKVGLGVMGFADMLVQLALPYDSKDAVEMARSVMRFIQEQARAASQALASKRGAFPNFESSIFNTGPEAPKMRNATVTTIAPTGTISIICNASSGIEPYFAVAYVRNVMDNTHLVEVNPIFRKLAREGGFDSPELFETVAREGSLRKLATIPDEVRRLFVTAHDIDPEWHIRIQAAFQEFTDNAVSKTVNFCHDASREDIEKVYLTAYELGCKGVTVYRDGSRENQVLNIGKVAGSGESDAAATGESASQDGGRAATSPASRSPRDSSVASEGTDVAPHGANGGFQPFLPFSRPRPSLIKGSTVSIKTGCGNLYVTINEDDQGRPFELFNHIGKAGGCAASQSEAIGRLISLALRTGLSVEPIIEQLKGISCHSHVWGEGGKVLSCADAIAKALEQFLEDSNKRRAHLGDGTEPRQPETSAGPAGYKKGNNGRSRKTSGKNSASDRGAGSGAAGTSKAPGRSRVKHASKGFNLRGACPDCGGILEHEEGCVLCRSCGHSECG